MKILKNLLNNFWRTPKKWQNSACLFLIIGFFVFLSWIYFSPRSDLNNFQRSDLKKQTAQIINQFKNIILEAKAAYVFDVLENRPLFELNSEVQLPLASLAKIMTAVMAVENLPSYLEVIIPQEAILQEGDEGFKPGEQWLVSELIDAMLVSSSNDAAFALAFEFEKIFGANFISLMNQKTKDLELAQTYFLNSTGLDLSKNVSGAYGSAKDAANLFLYILKNHPSLMEITRFGEIEINQRKFKNTNLLVNDLPGFIAGKTGFSDLAGGNLAIMIDKGYSQPFIIVVLGSTYDGRFTDVKTLYNLIP